jgi:hypothetical protein
MAIPDYQSSPRLTVVAAVLLALLAIASMLARLLVPDWEAWWR